MKFMYKDEGSWEEVTPKIISRASGKSILDIISIGKNTEDKNIILIGNTKYKVLQNKEIIKKSKKKNRKPRSNKIIIEDIIKSSEMCYGRVKCYKMDGKDIKISAIAEHIGISESYLRSILKNHASVTINKNVITMDRYKKETRKFVFKNGVLEENNMMKHTRSYTVDGESKTLQEISEMFGISESYFQTQTKHYKYVELGSSKITISKKRLLEKEHDYLYTISRDGEVRKSLQYRHVKEITGLNSPQIKKMLKSGNYSRNGWKIIKETK